MEYLILISPAFREMSDTFRSAVTEDQLADLRSCYEYLSDLIGQVDSFFCNPLGVTILLRTAMLCFWMYNTLFVHTDNQTFFILWTTEELITGLSILIPPAYLNLLVSLIYSI